MKWNNFHSIVKKNISQKIIIHYAPQKSNLHPFLVRALGFGVYNRLEKGANLTPALCTAEKVNI